MLDLGTSWTMRAEEWCYPIILGDLDRMQCRNFAELTADITYPGVIGTEDTALWFVERAIELGIVFDDPIPQQIHAIRGPPTYPSTPGHARAVDVADVSLFADWLTAFFREAVPHDPIPAREVLEKHAGSGQYLFWIDNRQPVSMAGIVRRTRSVAAIGGVYTPLSLRGRGYAGSATAALVEHIYAEGKQTACLYVDLRNPFSNRCYAKIGFEPYCRAWHIPRRTGEH